MESTLPPASKTFSDFWNEIEKLLDRVAREKGYNDTGVDGPNQLFAFIASQGLTHAEGEAVYKIVRWHTKRDPIDLLKAAAWCFLMWRYQGEE